MSDFLNRLVYAGFARKEYFNFIGQVNGIEAPKNHLAVISELHVNPGWHDQTGSAEDSPQNIVNNSVYTIEFTDDNRTIRNNIICRADVHGYSTGVNTKALPNGQRIYFPFWKFTGKGNLRIGRIPETANWTLTDFSPLPGEEAAPVGYGTNNVERVITLPGVSAGTTFTPPGYLDPANIGAGTEGSGSNVRTNFTGTGLMPAPNVAGTNEASNKSYPIVNAAIYIINQSKGVKDQINKMLLVT